MLPFSSWNRILCTITNNHKKNKEEYYLYSLVVDILIFSKSNFILGYNFFNKL